MYVFINLYKDTYLHRLETVTKAFDSACYRQNPNEFEMESS